MSPRADGCFDINAVPAASARGLCAKHHAMSARNRVAPFIVRLAYGCYAWLMLLAISLPMSLLLAVTPRLRQRREVARRAARLFLLAIGSPVRVAGAAADAHYPCVVVANHASYLDGIILTAALPAGFTYLVKREMAPCRSRASSCGGSAPRS